MKKKKPKIVIIGAGNQGRVVLDILREMRAFTILGFLDSNPNLKAKEIKGFKVLGCPEDIELLVPKGIEGVIVAIGDNLARMRIFQDIKKGDSLKLINAVHPTAFISSSAKLKEGVVISAGAIIFTDAVIGDNVIVNTGAIIEHDNIIGDNVHIASGVQLGGNVHIGEGSLIGIGATVVPNVNIGANVIVAAGAVVIEDIPDNVMVAGVPARIIKYKKVEV